MNPFHTRAVFFTRDAPAARAFYADRLGFEIDWGHCENDSVYVFQASLHGLELILNQTDEHTAARPGLGRVFVGLDDDQACAFIDHLRRRKIEYEVLSWGKPTLLIRDRDRNELFFWPPAEDWASLLG